MSVKKKILNCITDIPLGEQFSLSTTEIAEKLGVKRNTVSHYLNQLVDEKKVIKIITRPVLFVDRKQVEDNTDVPIKNSYESIEELKSLLKNEGVFSKVVGYDGSLYSQIRKLKAAASYPNGLPILITGQTGTGKSYLAKKFYEYCVSKKFISSSGNFISFNCAEYADNPELLASTLFGYVRGAFTGAESSHNGIFDEADGGVLFLDEVHRLDPKGQEKLFSYLDNGTISPLGDASRNKKLNVRLVFATTENIKSSFLSTFIRRIPVQITMPPLSERTSGEILSLIIHFYIQQAKDIQRPIKIDSQVVSILVNISYENNVGQLKNIILLSVANAIRNIVNMNSEYVYIKLADLNQNVLLSSTKRMDRIFVQRKNDSIVYPKSKISDIISIHKNYNHIKSTLQNVLDSYNDSMSFDHFREKAENQVNSLCDYLIFKKEDANIGELPLKFIKRVFNKKIGYLQDDLKNDFNGNVIVAVSTYFYYRQESPWKMTIREEKISNKIIKKINNEEYKSDIVDTVIRVANGALNLYTDEIDYLFLTIYLGNIQKKKSLNIMHGVLLAHGYSTASSIADTVNKIAGATLLDSFDMPIDIQPEDIAKKISNYIHIRRVRNGLILMVDMGSLEKLPELLKPDLDFPIAIFNNVSTQLALFVASNIKEGKPLETIVKEVDKTIYNDYKVIYPRTIKPNVIIVCCTTGFGTSGKIKSMITESLPKKVDLEILAYDYDFLKLNEQEKAMKRKYNVLAIIGTLNPNYFNIPFISLDQLVNGSKLRTLQNLLKGILNFEELQNFNHLIVRNFTIERVINSLTILDTNEVMKNIDLVLEKLAIFMNVNLSNKTKMALYVHLSCMIERIIRNQALDKGPINFEEDDNVTKCLEYIRQALSVLENAYSIKIPLNEVKYIYELIFNSEKSKNESDGLDTNNF